MAYPVNLNGILTNEQSINAIAAAEASILQCMSDLFYDVDNNGALIPRTLVSNVIAVNDIDEDATLIKDILCAFACKEFAIADILNSLACRLSFENRSMISEDCDCGCKTK